MTRPRPIRPAGSCSVKNLAIEFRVSHETNFRRRQRCVFAADDVRIVSNRTDGTPLESILNRLPTFKSFVYEMVVWGELGHSISVHIRPRHYCLMGRRN